MANGGNITFGINYSVDSSGLNSLKSSLQSIQKIKPADFSGTREELREVTQTAKQVEQALNKAFNVNLNSINVSSFNSQLKNADLTVEKIYTDFSKVGAQGQVAFSQMASSVLTTNLQLKETHSLIQNMGTTMMNTVKWGIASSIMNTFAQSVQSAFSYVQGLESSLTSIRIVTGDSTEKMEQFAQQANNAAQALGRSTLDYTKASLTFYQQGLDDEAVAARTEAVLKAQNITGAGEEMADYLTSVWNGYKVASEEAEIYVDKLAAVADSSASDMSELAIAMSKVASTANVMGVNVDQLNAQIATVVATTRAAPESVGTAFKTIYSRLNDIKAGADDAEISLGNYSGKMASLGFNVLDANNQLRDTGQVMEEIGQRWGTLTREQQVYLAQTMGGQRQITQVMALFDNWTTYTELLNTSLESEGTLAEKNARYMDSLGAKMEQFGAAGEKVKDALIDSESFKSLLDILTGITNTFGSFIQSIGGGGNMLLALGSIATRVFGQTIATEINNTITNIQNARNNAALLKQDIENTETFGKSQGYMSGTIKEMVDAKEKIQQYYKVMSEQEINSYNNIVRQIGAEKQREIVLKEQIDDANKFNEALAKAAEAKINTSDFNDRLEATVEIAEHLQEILKNTTLANLNRGTEEGEERIQEIISAIEELRALTDGSTNTELFPAFRDFENITRVDAEGVRDLTGSVGELRRVASAVFSQVYGKTGISLALDETEQQLQEVRQSLKLLEQDTDRIANSKKQLFDVNNITQTVGAIGQLSSSLLSIKNLITNVWGNENLSGAEKILQTLTNIGFTLPMIITSLSRVKDAFKPIALAKTADTAQEAANTAATTANTLAREANTKAIQAQIKWEKANKALKEGSVLFENLEEEAIQATVVAKAAKTAATQAETVATEQATVAQTALNVAMDANPIGLIILGITALVAAIAGGIALYDKFTMSVEEANQALENFDNKQKEVTESTKQYSSQISELEDAKDEWDDLSRRAGAYNSTITNLTDEQKQRYYELSNLIAEYNSAAVIGYDAQGNAIIDLNSSLEDTIELLKEKRQLEIDSLYSGEEYQERRKGEQALYEDALEGQESAQNRLAAFQDRENLNSRELYDSNEMQYIEALSLAIQQLSSFSQDQDSKLREYYDTLIEIQNEGFENFSNRREEALQILAEINEQEYEDGLINEGNIQSAYDRIHGLSENYDKAIEELEAASQRVKETGQLDSKVLLGVLSTSDYNEFYNEAKESGLIAVDSIITGYIEGLSRADFEGSEDPYQDIANQINEELLGPLTEAFVLKDEQGNIVGNLQDSLLEQVNNFNEINFNSLQSKINATKGNLQDFLDSNSEQLAQLYEAAAKDSAVEKALEQYFASLYGLDNVDIDFSEGTAKVVELVDESLQDGLSSVQNAISESAGLSEDTNLITAYLKPDVTQAGLDQIAKKFIQLYDGTKDWKQVLEEAQEEVRKINNTQQNLSVAGLLGTSQVADIYEKQRSGKSLTKDEAEVAQTIADGLASLRQEYPELIGQIDILSNSWLAGTDAYNLALTELKDTLYQSAAAQLETGRLTEEQINSLNTSVVDSVHSADDALRALEEGAFEGFRDEAGQLSEDLRNQLPANLAFTSESLLQLVELLQEGLITTQDFSAALQQVSDTEIASYGIDTDKYESYVQLLKDTNEEYANNEYLARQVAMSNLRITEGTEDLISSWDDWNDAIQDYLKSDKDIIALADSWEDLRLAIANTLDMDVQTVDMLGPDFVADNWQKIEAVKDGVEGAWEELDQLTSQTLIINAIGVTDFSELDQGIQDAYDLINQTNDDLTVQVGAVFSGQDDLIAAFNEIVDAANWTSDQAQAAFSQMGYDVEVAAKDPQIHESSENTQYYVPPKYSIQTIPGGFDFAGNPATFNIPIMQEGGYYASAPSGVKESYEPGAYSIKTATKKGKSSGGNISRNAVRSSTPRTSSKKSSGGSKKSPSKKSSGSTKTKAPDTMKAVDDTQDRYHDINLELKRIDTTLDDVQDKQKKLAGKDLIDNLDKQLDLLDDQIEAYKVKLELEQQEADELHNSLASQGALFDKNTGALTNYSTLLSSKLATLNDQINYYNTLSAEEQQKYKPTVEAAKKEYEQFKKDLERYDDLISSEMPSLRKSTQQDLDKQIELQISKFKMRVDLELDMSKAERDFNKFRKEVINKIRKDDVLGNAKAQFDDLSSYYKSGLDVIDSLTDQVNGTLAQLQQMDKTGTSSVYGSDRAKALEDLEKYSEELMNNLEDIEDLVQDIKDSIYDAIDDTQKAFDEQVKEYEYISDLIDHNASVTKLLYGDDAYEALEKYYDKQEENNTKQLDFLKQQRDLWYSRMMEQQKRMNALPKGSNEWKEAQDRFEEYKQHWMDSVKDLNSQVETSIQNIIDKYSNTIDKTFDKLNDKLTGGRGLDNINEEWELINKQADMYLDKVNSMYEIDKLESAYRDAIKDNDGNLAAQKSLNDMMNEQLKMLKDKEKLTQYDVDRANALLQIEVKRLALQQAQQNKTKLRLRRDSQGNYTYQYVADETETSQAEQELADAQNSLYNMTKEAYKSNLDSYYDMTEEWQSKVKDVYKDTTLTAEEQQEKIAMLNKYYGNIINGLTEQNESLKKYMMLDTFDELAKMYNVDVENFRNMSDKEKDILMKDTIPYWDSGIQHMADVVAGEGGLVPTVAEAFDELDNAVKDFADSVGEIEKTAGTGTTGVDDTDITRAEKLLDTNKDLIQAYSDELTAVQNVADQVDKLIEKYQTAEDAAIKATSAAYKYEQTANGKAAKAADNPTIYGTPSSFDTGGYTGSWGNNGRAAILHEKELVLNQTDTSNILNAINIVRSMDSLLSSLTGNINLPSVLTQLNGAAAQETQLDQNVRIEAHFPNATNHSEIEKAFENIVNRASQFAYNSRR